MLFYLGTHRASWLGRTDTPLFLSRRLLADRRTFPRAQGEWVLDSGGYTELALHGRWSVTVEQYAREVSRYAEEIGGLRWAAPMDWMCEPNVLRRTGLTVRDHQARTVTSYLRLCDLLGDLVVPVLQGWTLRDYLACADLYAEAGVDLEAAAVVGVGSVCRRHADDDIVRILDALSRQGFRLHAFGVRSRALRRIADALTSADSLAWSYEARTRALNDIPTSCGRRSCANCLHYALEWRARQLAALHPLRLEYT